MNAIGDVTGETLAMDAHVRKSAKHSPDRHFAAFATSHIARGFADDFLLQSVDQDLQDMGQETSAVPSPMGHRLDPAGGLADGRRLPFLIALR